MRAQRYKDPRPREAFTRYHERSRTHDPDWVYGVGRIVVTLVTIPAFRIAALGTENIPPSGPVILAPNHFSHWDHFFCAIYCRRRIRFMSKSQLFGHPLQSFILSHGGTFPIRRGDRDEDAFATAHSILERGGCLLLYPEGGRSRSRALGEPRPGIGRLALESGAPVVPVAIHGSDRVRDWRRLRLPKVTVRYGEPLDFEVVESPSRDRQIEASERIFERVREMHVGLEESGRREVRRALREGRSTDGRGPVTAPAGRK
jgi:1-acyl-sn-glycerol-3-phosphate acyltransferase